MLISNIKQTVPGRLTVEFDSGTAVKTTLGVVTELRLYSGKELDNERLEEFRLLSHRSLAREKALEILSKRPMSRMELYKKLLEKGEDETDADYCVSWLADNGLINDESYAGAVARHYAAKGMGAGRIKTELSKRGISRELWEDALDAAPDNSEKIDKFIASRLKDPNDRAQVGKVGQALYRRGFSWDEIRQALARYNAEVEE
ncbi:MAG: regulatory protein RecX [Eubacteriales bacterium]|nr:regulatory protein RecX [Eubacteriales bacterium]